MPGASCGLHVSYTGLGFRVLILGLRATYGFYKVKGFVFWVTYGFMGVWALGCIGLGFWVLDLALH